MIDLSTYKKKLFLERFIIGVEEPILIKPVGEFVAKIDSGNSGYNVIHGENIQRQGKMLFFTTYDKNGMMKNVSKPVHEEVSINMGGGHVETRPVVLLDVKFADTDYEKIPFSVSDRTNQVNKVLICKDFVCNQLGALIDPSAKEISGQNIQATVVKEKRDGVISTAQNTIQKWDTLAKNFGKGEGGALTSFLADKERGRSSGKSVEKSPNKEKKEKVEEQPLQKQQVQPQQQEPESTKQALDLTEDQYQQFIDVIKSKKEIEKDDAARARNTAARNNLLNEFGFESSNMYKDTAYWPLLDYLGYSLGDATNSHQAKLRKDLQQILKKEKPLNASVDIEDGDLECIFEENGEYFDNGQTPTQTAAQNMPEEPLPQGSDIVKAFFDRNYFSFGLLQMSSPKLLPEDIRVFQKIQKTRSNYFVSLGEKLFNNIVNRTFMPTDQYSVEFVKGCVNELQKQGISGAICVNVGAPPHRITRFYTAKGLTLKAGNTDQTKIERTILDLYTGARHRWINDSFLRDYKFSINLERDYYENLLKEDLPDLSAQLPINAMLRIYDIVDLKTDVNGEKLSAEGAKFDYIKRITGQAFEKVKPQLVPYTPQTGNYRVRPVAEEMDKIRKASLEWIQKHTKDDIDNFQNSLKKNDSAQAIKSIDAIQKSIEDKVNFVNPETITKHIAPVMDLLKKFGNDADTLQSLMKANIFKI